MKNVDTDKIIGTGLVVALLVNIIAPAFGVAASAELSSNIVACLAGYMGRSLLEKFKHGDIQNDGPQNKSSQRSPVDEQTDRSNLINLTAVKVPERKFE